MMELGEQTQKGQLFLDAVQGVSVSQDKSDGEANIELLCEDRRWVFRPENASSFQAWMDMLEKFTRKERWVNTKEGVNTNDGVISGKPSACALVPPPAPPRATPPPPPPSPQAPPAFHRFA